ncbi:MAG: hypothetical protein RI947_1127 [Candidatus Parcubacteria bacterium]
MISIYRKYNLVIILILFTVVFVGVSSYRAYSIRVKAATCAAEQADADCDGNIDITDFEIFRKEYLGELTTISADFDRDGAITIADFELWRRAYFDAAVPSVTSVATPIATATGVPASPTQQATQIPTQKPTNTVAPTASPIPTVVGDATLQQIIDHNYSFAVAQLSKTITVVKSTAYPDITNSTGAWNTSGSSSWTSGFFPGTLWLLYEKTQDPKWKTAAQSWQAGIESQKNNTSTHDVGFMLMSSFGQGARLTNDPAYKQVLLTGAKSLSTRYSSVVGCIRSWDSSASEYKVIIDNMMNLELLFWAAKNGGDPAFYTIALSHALKTSENHVRPDGSTYHLVTYDPASGGVKSKTTVQGYSNTSAWSRGQAWAIYGFAIAYRETRDSRMLDTARKVADYYVSHLPADNVPYWDFQAPNIPNEPRDSSSAAIAASGLLELHSLETDAAKKQQYYNAAVAIIRSLSGAGYSVEGTKYSSLLLHGTQNKNKGNYDTGIVYGDYYFLQALRKL